MSRINLQFTICGQKIQRKDTTPLAANSVGFTGAFFTFDSSWNGLVKTAVFESMSGSSYDVLLGTQNECECNVASEVLSLTGNGGRFYVSVKGTELDGNALVTRATANKVEIFFEESCSLSGANVGTPTPTVPEQVISALAKSQWLTGTAVTGTGTGISAIVENAAVECHYLNTDTGYYYICTAVADSTSTWNYVGSLKGAQGIAGKDLMPVSTHREFADWKALIPMSYRAVAIACDDFDTYSDGDIICVDKNAMGVSTITSYSIVGTNGANGTDGITPHIDSTNKHWFIGTTDTGVVAEGQNGTDGEDGEDGYSPSVTVTDITGGHRVTITDETHPQGQSFDVMDGQSGAGAVSSVNGKTGAIVLDADDVGALPDDTIVPTTLAELTGDSTHRTVTDAEKSSWNGRYTKPASGIPYWDLYSGIQERLDILDEIQNFVDDSENLVSSDGIKNALDTKVNSSALRNDYHFAIPKYIYLRKDVAVKLYYSGVINDNYNIKLGNYSDSMTVRNTDNYCQITPTAAATKDFYVGLWDNHLNLIEEHQINVAEKYCRIKISDTAPNNQTMLLLGDSFIAMDNDIASKLRTLFTADGKTLTLLGTKGSGDNRHEGYAGKKFTDFANGFSGSPFGTSGFDFSTYMSNQGYSGVDKVYIQLGTNDVSAGTVNQDVSSILTAAQTIINSILSYNASIKILLGLTVMPNSDSVTFSQSYYGTGVNWIMRDNMQRLNKALIDYYRNSSSVTIVPTNMILDTTVDIRDNVHPTSNGYQKIANQVYYTLMGM